MSSYVKGPGHVLVRGGTTCLLSLNYCHGQVGTPRGPGAPANTTATRAGQGSQWHCCVPRGWWVVSGDTVFVTLGKVLQASSKWRPGCCSAPHGAPGAPHVMKAEVRAPRVAEERTEEGRGHSGVRPPETRRGSWGQAILVQPRSLASSAPSQGPLLGSERGHAGRRSVGEGGHWNALSGRICMRLARLPFSMKARNCSNTCRALAPLAPGMPAWGMSGPSESLDAVCPTQPVMNKPARAEASQVDQQGCGLRYLSLRWGPVMRSGASDPWPVHCGQCRCQGHWGRGL